MIFYSLPCFLVRWHGASALTRSNWRLNPQPCNCVLFVSVSSRLTPLRWQLIFRRAGSEPEFVRAQTAKALLHVRTLPGEGFATLSPLQPLRWPDKVAQHQHIELPSHERFLSGLRAFSIGVIRFISRVLAFKVGTSSPEWLCMPPPG